jgi:hypothetical protein
VNKIMLQRGYNGNLLGDRSDATITCSRPHAAE